MQLDNNTLFIVVGAGLFLLVLLVGFVLTSGEAGSKGVKRMKQLDAGNGTSRSSKPERNDTNNQRRKKTQAMLNKLREEDQARRKSLVANNNIEAKLTQAGLDMSPSLFWIVSAVLALISGVGIWYTGAEGPPPVAGIEIKSRPAMIVAAAIAGGIGFPRWVLGMMAKGRNKKMMNQFADGIDIIVRGVKSGLPLAECLRIISKESPAPLGPEFKQLTDNIQMGTTLDRALHQFYKRVPLPEVNFFVIVLSIQSKSGGNLSEALGNLSIVIRSRKMMREKIKALSSEAKASAMIIGALPFAVAFMVYLTTPSYIIELFITSTGHMILFMAFCMMSVGILVMRKMISFDF
ncbi:MAG: type II secretion system F family protein [Pseudomonadota bacterium]